ncbi:MAG: MotA/TolQ/ExbB proton channel family protein [Candidatus Omnitrophica bacterium]|nr:MotA/TolQ/ExbB proton channel family protein [Candidatus Omnitrophota bacterium]MBU0895220.1 MotA/TolQ/ExbB proton channel family protein [Candidatus Omnitrophota bacterium]MBU1808480.1 MotA/TolQ/ExbB proton channel family protein [Candidatus Omnitrophota bacterium]
MIWMIKGGPVMIPIIFGSILGLAIIICKLWQLYGIRMDAEKFTEGVISRVRLKRFDEAIEYCSRNTRYPLAITLKAGLEKRTLAVHEIEKVLERVGNTQVKRLEKYIGGLISIIGIEPLLGFLGTITGLIKAFMAWERAGSNVTVSQLAAGIYGAMVTTAAGLIVAVPFYLICNFIISRIKYVSYELSDSSMQLVEAIVEAKHGA